MINKSGRRTRADKEFDDFGKEPVVERTYSDRELQDFHNKIQKYHEPKTIQNPNAEDFGQTYLILNFNKLAVAFGAFRIVEQGTDPEGKPVKYYLSTPERYLQLNNLWKAYEDWRKKMDWVAEKEAERLEQVSETVAF